MISSTSGSAMSASLAIIAVVIASSLSTSDAADILCYACNSYMSQCQQPTMATGPSNVFQARCTSKCFTRQGEDDAIYRGCFDAFKAVKQLSDEYVGCRNQTWNNRVRRWCLCDTDLCNTHSLEGEQVAPQKEQQPASPSQQQQQQHYSTASSNGDGGVSSHTIPSTTHHTHHVVVHQQTYAAPSQPTQYVSGPVSRQAGGQGHLPEILNVTEKTADSSRYQGYPHNTAEYRTVWNNWLVNDVGRSHATTEATSNVQGANIGSSDGVWIDAPRGVVHSVHHDQQPTWNYGDATYSHDNRESQHGAKSAGLDAETQNFIEPITNAATTVNDSDSSTGQREEFELLSNGHVVERITVQNGQVVERVAVNNPQMVESQAIADGAAGEQSSDNGGIELTIEVDGELIGNDTSAEVLEYPYNQEFISHPISWAPIEYAPETTEQATVYATSPVTKQAPETVVDNTEKVDNKDYPYNQYKLELSVDENYGDYSSALKEGPTETEEQPEELGEKSPTIDYPYNQLMILDNFGNPASDVDAAVSEDVTSTKDQQVDQTRRADETVHIGHKTTSSIPRRHDSHSIADDADARQHPVTSVGTDERQDWVRLDQTVVHHQPQQDHLQPQQQQQHYQQQQEPQQQQQQQYVEQVHQRHPLMQPQLPTISPTSASLNEQPKYSNHGHPAEVKEILHTKSSIYRPSPSSDRPSHSVGVAPAGEMAPLRTKDDYDSTPRHGEQNGRHGGDTRRDTGDKSNGPHAKEANDDGVEYEKVDSHTTGQQNPQIPQIQCSQTGYYQNPKDCTQFVACLFDHNTRTKVLHLMRCPSGLVWDNLHKLCMETSSTCREGVSQADLDSNYLQFFADVNAVASSAVGDGVEGNQQQQQQQHLLNDIQIKHEVSNE